MSAALRIRAPFALERALPVGVVVYALVVVALQANGRLSVSRAALLLVAPILAWFAIRAPGWLVVAFVAIPPGVLTSIRGINIGSLTVLFAGTLIAYVVVKGRVSGGGFFALAPYLVLVAGAYWTLDAVDPAAASAATEFRRALVLYAVLFLLAYVLVRDGELRLPDLGTALLVSAGISGIIFFWQTGGRPWTYTSTNLSSDIEPGLLFYRTHFGYMMALGFAVALAHAVARHRIRHRTLDLIVLGFFSLLVLFSFARGAWLVALILIALIPLRTGKKLYWLLLPVLALIATSIPLIQDRLFSDLSGGLQRSFDTGEFATGRWGLWQELWDRALPGMPWGRGFGFVWGLSPEALFGADAFTTEDNPFVYAHNDFIYWTVELGLIGLGAMLVFWARLVSVVRKVAVKLAAVEGGVGFVGGVVLTMFVASMFDNGLFIRAIAERVFIIIGAAWAIAHTRGNPEPATP